jgi:hypothetical protein
MAFGYTKARILHPMTHKWQTLPAKIIRDSFKDKTSKTMMDVLFTE